MLQILDTRMGFPSPSLNVVFDYFSHSCLKMCKICLKRTLDATFLDCLALTFCDVIGELLPEWACLTLQGGTTFLLTSKFADIPVSRVRKHFPTRAKFGYRSVSSGRKTCHLRRVDHRYIETNLTLTSCRSHAYRDNLVTYACRSQVYRDKLVTYACRSQVYRD